jgi:hypothetical protein
VILDPVRAEFPDIELTVDANSAYTLDDIDVLRKIDQFGLHYIEQPLHWDDLVDHAALAPQLDTPLCLDETLTSPARVKAALDLGRVRGGQRQGRTGRRAGRDQTDPRPVRVPRRTDVVRRNVGDRHRPGTQHPRRDDAGFRVSGRHRIGEPYLRPRHHRAGARGRQRDHARFHRVPGIGVTLDRPFLDTVTQSVEVIRR